MNNIITIITPSLNQGQYIEKTITSVLGQGGNFFIDYIIADGNSIDNSVEIIKKFDNLLKKQKYPVKCNGVELRWWSRSDKGQTYALNHGFKIAKGDICAWINSDDWYENGAFEFVAQKFKDNPEVDLIYGNVYEVYEDGKVLNGESGPSDFEKNLNEGCQIFQPGAFFTKRALEKAGYLDESFNYCMDYDLWMKILKVYKSLYVNQDLAYFRIWPGSKTSKYLKKFKKEEDSIRKKYSGCIINPGKIHRWRYKMKWTNSIKRRFPRFYNLLKKVTYKLINLLRY